MDDQTRRQIEAEGRLDDEVSATSIPEVMQELRAAETQGDRLGMIYQEVGNMTGLPEKAHVAALDALINLTAAAEPRKLAAVDIEDHSKPSPVGDDYAAYAALADVLNDAYMQAARGKGSRRHSAGKPFLEQPILEIVRMQTTIDGHTYQIMKKAQEAGRMLSRGRYNAAVAELYGVINYAAAAVIRAREMETEASIPDSSLGYPVPVIE